MATPIRIQVVRDENGQLTAETDAQVVVGRRDLLGDSRYPHDDLVPTFTHDSDGHYVNATGDPKNEPAAGEWLIVVRKAGHALVVQRLTFVEKDGILRAVPDWKRPERDSVTAATVTIVNFDQVRGEPKAKQSLITIRLFPSQRYVGMGCKDNHGGTRFVLFASGRRDFLFDEGKLNPGTVATLFDCLKNELLFTVKSAKSAANHWLVLERRASSKLGILDFYASLQEIGTKDAGSVAEAGVFGHAWHQGPIVQDTFDTSDDLSKRDPADLDGRPKDWFDDGTVAQQFPQFQDAFAADGRLVIWGCSHMVNAIAEAGEANRRVTANTPRNSFYRVVLTDGGRLNTTLDYSKRSIAQYVVSTKRGRYPEHGSASGQCSYGGVMARALRSKVPSFVATPGMGANFGSVKGPRRKDSQQLTHITMHVVDDGENIQVRRYFQREYGSSYERDARLYMNYTKFLDVSLPDPGWNTERFCKYFWDAFPANLIRLPSGLEMVRRPRANFDDPITFAQGGETGHLYVARRATPGSVQIRGPSKFFVVKPSTATDVAVFVTQTGKSILLERPAGNGAFGTPSVLPAQFTMKLVFDPQYEFPEGDDGTPLSSNVIEEVEPKWFW